MSERDEQDFFGAVEDINAGLPYKPAYVEPIKKAIPPDGTPNNAEERLPSSEIAAIADSTTQVGMTIRRDGHLR